MNHRRPPIVYLLALILLIFAPTAKPAHAAKAEHVLVVICDGMRPDAVNPQDMPTLWKLAHGGVFFQNHHAVYPSSTEVNGTAIATGLYPRNSGIVANREYRADTDPFQAVGTESDYMIWKGDQLHNGAFLAKPTLVEIVRKSGRSTAVAGTKPVALLLDRGPRDAKPENSAIVFAGAARPSALIDELRTQFGPLPTVADSKRRADIGQDEWTTRVLLEKLWAKEVPALSMLWLSEPDFSQHGAGPGSKVARAALKSCDDNLARVLATLEDRKLRDKTDILVVSDHGFSTIGYTIELADDLKKSGLKAATSFASEPAAGDVLVVGNGGTICLYVTQHEPAVIGKVVEFLQTSEFAGVIFTQKPMPGTFTLDQAAIDAKDAPDIVVALRWWDDTSASGLPGMVVSEGHTYGHAQGMHASLSPFEMHNTLIAAGPDFRGGFSDKLPSGNADIAPTVLWLLGIKGVEMDGRVLAEALNDAPPVQGQPQTTVLDSTTKLGDLRWRQYLKLTKFDGRVYFDEGNGRVLVDR